MQETDNLNDNLGKIQGALERYRGQSRTGSQIHQIIRDVAPDLDIRSVVEIPAGPGALTKFIETFLHELVTRIGNQGGDILYGIGEDVVHPPRAGNPNLWKAFVSPNAVNSLYLATSDMSLRVSDSMEIDEADHHIKRVSQGEHDAIRQDFLSSISDDQRALIDSQADEDSSYDAFVVALRSNGLMKIWGKHRRDAFKRLFAERLKEISIADELIPQITDQLMASQMALFTSEENKTSTRQLPSSSNTLQNLALRPSDNLDAARSFARTVIDHMGYEELRKLDVPFGAVLDALHSQK